jgi:hypothetical protein
VLSAACLLCLCWAKCVLHHHHRRPRRGHAGPSGRTALHTAVSRCSREVSELLLANGADINAV